VDAILKIKPVRDNAVETSHQELEDNLAGGYGIFSGKATHAVVLRFSARRARWVSAETWHPDQKRDGLAMTGRLASRYSHPRELIMDIMRYGTVIEAISPSQLGTQVHSLHLKTVNWL
jgi:hypothetical protein